MCRNSVKCNGETGLTYVYSCKIWNVFKYTYIQAFKHPFFPLNAVITLPGPWPTLCIYYIFLEKKTICYKVIPWHRQYWYFHCHHSSNMKPVRQNTASPINSHLSSGFGEIPRSPERSLRLISSICKWTARKVVIIAADCSKAQINYNINQLNTSRKQLSKASMFWRCTLSAAIVNYFL